MDELPKIRIDMYGHRVWLGDKGIHFSRMEFGLLAYLAENAGNVVSRRAILRDVWGTDWVGSGRTIDMHLGWVRRKLGDDVKNPRYISTVRGVGFRLEAGTVEVVKQQTGPDTSVTRVVLVKRGDVLAFGNVGEVSERVEAAAGALRDQLGLGAVLLFPGDVDMTAVPADRSKP